MTAVHLRAGGREDLAELVRLETSVFSCERLSPRRFRHWLQTTNGVLLVATGTGGLFGYGLVLLRRDSHVGRLYSLAVDPPAQGQGIGRRLLAALELEAARRGCRGMRLEVAVDNASALQLYHSMGYRTTGRLPAYYEDHRDAWRLCKTFAESPH